MPHHQRRWAMAPALRTRVRLLWLRRALRSDMPAHHDHPATVLIIGAGKIGRGLLGERFYTAPTPSGNIGWSIVFDDID